jgi:hypothetical protein
LNAHCGLDLVTAREKVRIAHALPKLPLIRAAFRRGELSYSMRDHACRRLGERGGTRRDGNREHGGQSRIVTG